MHTYLRLQAASDWQTPATKCTLPPPKKTRKQRRSGCSYNGQMYGYSKRALLVIIKSPVGISSGYIYCLMCKQAEGAMSSTLMLVTSQLTSKPTHTCNCEIKRARLLPTS